MEKIFSFLFLIKDRCSGFCGSAFLGQVDELPTFLYIPKATTLTTNNKHTFLSRTAKVSSRECDVT